jgi:excisionase family DNA binding protein
MCDRDCPANVWTLSVDLVDFEVGTTHLAMSDEISTPPVRAGTRKHTTARRTTSLKWIGLNEASRRLGVSATTLRRWADAGVVRTFVTPGGHRRFDINSVRALLPGHTGRPTMEQLGETPERIARAYRRAGRHDEPAWVSALTDAQRDTFREHGQGIARELLAALDASTETDRASHIALASQTAAQYGVAAAARGLGLGTTVETFLQFRRPFVTELLAVARRRGLDTAATTDLIGRAGDAVDQLLVATVRAYEQAAVVHAAATSPSVRGPR